MTTPQWFKPQAQQTPGKVAYTNARLMDPASNLDVKGALLTDGTTIADFGEKLFHDGVPEGISVVDCGGHVLCPGLLDIQVHFREPGQEHKETLETGSKSAAAGGITTVVCQPNTKPVLDNPQILSFLKERAAETSYINIMAYGCISKHMQDKELTEMSLMKESGIIAGFTDDGLPVMNSLLMRRAFEMSRMLELPIAQHAEDRVLSDGGCINEGKISAQLGVKGIANATEAIIVARDIQLLMLTGGYYHVLHVSTLEAVDLIRDAKKRGLNITAEAAPHHFWLTEDAVLEHHANAKMNPPLRTEADRLAVIEGLKDGTLDSIATDHAPHDLDTKTLPLSSASFGIVGVETMLPLSLKLYHDNHLSLMEVLRKMTSNPAKVIHSPLGVLKKGGKADLTLIDINAPWNINPQAFASKSKNSPFVNTPVKGRAIRTVAAGKTVFKCD